MREHDKKQQSIISFKFVSMVALLIVVVSGGWRLVDSSPEAMMPIENIQIEGEFVNLRPGDIRKKVVDVLSGGYFTVDLNAIRNVLLELPWIEEVTVRRQWPLSLRIRVLEKKSIAYWGRKSLISDQGELFSPENINRNQVLPRLSGPDDLHNKVVSFYGELSKKLLLAGFEVNSLSLDERRAWRMEISKSSNVRNIKVRLGRTDVDRRLERFIKVFSMHEMSNASNIQTIDLRYPNGFAMFRKAKNKNNREAKMTTLGAEV